MDKRFDLENFPTSPSALKMLGYVTEGFYDKSYVGKWLYQVMGLEYDATVSILESLPDQMFLETATWGLMYHEQKWGLPIRNDLPYEERRRQIRQKRDQRKAITPYYMEEYLHNATGLEVHISDAHDPGDYGYVPEHPNMFKVYLSGEGTLDVQEVREILNKMKQSHTTYEVNDRAWMEVDCKGIESILFPILVLAYDIHAMAGHDVGVKMRLAQKVNMSEKVEGEVIIFRDLWYLNGEYNLDGTRIWDTIYKEEKL